MVVEVIELATLEPLTGQLLEQLLRRLVLTTTENNLEAIFERIVRNAKHRLLCQGLQIFIEMKMRKEETTDEGDKFNKRLAILDSIFASAL